MMRQRLRLLLLACMLVSLFLQGMGTALADPTNMVVQVRKTGGGALNGAEVCVGVYNNPCPNGPDLTQGNGIAVIKMGVGDGPYEVLVTVTHPDYKTQNREVNFQPGQPSVRFILEPNAILIPPSATENITINAMSINGQATHTTSSSVQVGWHTNQHFDKYWLSLSPDFLGVQVINVSPRTSSTTSFTIPSPVPGNVYTIYLKVEYGNYGSNIQSASITFGPPPGPTTKLFKLSSPNSIRTFLRAALDKGYKFTAQATTPSTKCRTQIFQLLFARSTSAPIIKPRLTCRYEYFQKGGPNLASGWKLQSVLFRPRCRTVPTQPCPDKIRLVGPKNTTDPYFMVLHTPVPPEGKLELIEMVFVGPASATTVTEALQ